jgi:SAM-dependent methyltransferase
MRLPARFTPQRRLMQLAWYGARKPTKLLDRVNSTNIFLARQFSKVKIRCNVCGQNAGVWYEMHSVRQSREHRVGLLRETLECLNCISRMRYRIMAYGLLRECRERLHIDADAIADLVPRLRGIDVLDTDAYSPIARMMSRVESYKLSSYIPELPPGYLPEKGLYNVDLQAMPFADKSLDIILSSDVMEHVRHLHVANREIFRCLKPGGVHIFTVPYDQPGLTTRTLIDTTTGEDIYLEPAQMHGDDHLKGAVPAYRIYGMDLLDDLRASGFEADLVHVHAAENGIYNAAYFVARRPANR